MFWLLFSQLVYAAPLLPVPLKAGNYEVRMRIESNDKLTSAVEERVRQRCLTGRTASSPFAYFEQTGKCQATEWTGGKSANWEQFCLSEAGIPFGGMGRMEFGDVFYAGRVLLRASQEDAPGQETRITISAQRLGACGEKPKRMSAKASGKTATKAKQPAKTSAKKPGKVYGR